MKLRRVTIFSGQTFDVPQSIQRLDDESTHAWQLRYRRGHVPTEIFSDFTNDGSGAGAALARAIAALHTSIQTLEAPTGLRTNSLDRKTSDLPVGVSGPTLRNENKVGKTPYFCFQVSIPLESGGSTTKSVYIGTIKTRSAEREDAALTKAINLRTEAEAKVRVAKTAAKRLTARKFLLAKDRTPQ